MSTATLVKNELVVGPIILPKWIGCDQLKSIEDVLFHALYWARFKVRNEQNQKDEIAMEPVNSGRAVAITYRMEFDSDHLWTDDEHEALGFWDTSATQEEHLANVTAVADLIRELNVPVREYIRDAMLFKGHFHSVCAETPDLGPAPDYKLD